MNIVFGYEWLKNRPNTPAVRLLLRSRVSLNNPDQFQQQVPEVKVAIEKTAKRSKKDYRLGKLEGHIL